MKRNLLSKPFQKTALIFLIFFSSIVSTKAQYLVYSSNITAGTSVNGTYLFGTTTAGTSSTADISYAIGKNTGMNDDSYRATITGGWGATTQGYQDITITFDTAGTSTDYVYFKLEGATDYVSVQAVNGVALSSAAALTLNPSDQSGEITYLPKNNTSSNPNYYRYQPGIQFSSITLRVTGASVLSSTVYLYQSFIVKHDADGTAGCDYPYEVSSYASGLSTGSIDSVYNAIDRNTNRFSTSSNINLGSLLSINLATTKTVRAFFANGGTGNDAGRITFYKNNQWLSLGLSLSYSSAKLYLNGTEVGSASVGTSTLQVPILSGLFNASSVVYVEPTTAGTKFDEVSFEVSVPVGGSLGSGTEFSVSDVARVPKALTSDEVSSGTSCSVLSKLNVTTPTSGYTYHWYYITDISDTVVDGTTYYDTTFAELTSGTTYTDFGTVTLQDSASATNAAILFSNITAGSKLVYVVATRPTTCDASDLTSAYLPVTFTVNVSPTLTPTNDSVFATATRNEAYSGPTISTNYGTLSAFTQSPTDAGFTLSTGGTTAALTASTVSGTATADYNQETITVTASNSGCTTTNTYYVPFAWATPVTYEDPLSATISGSKVKLAWTTAQEVNNKAFEVQRSSDGISFSTITTVASQAKNGNSSSAIAYTYNDSLPLSGNNFYRLNQIDLDGTSALGNVVSVYLLSGGQEASLLYPNPATNYVVLLNGQVGSNYKVVNAGGQVVSTGTITSTTQNISVVKLASGVYFVQFNNTNNAVKTLKFIKK